MFIADKVTVFTGFYSFNIYFGGGFLRMMVTVVARLNILQLIKHGSRQVRLLYQHLTPLLY